MTMKDLESFRVQVDDPWTVPLGDARMHIPPPPAGGALLAFILKLIEGFMHCLITQSLNLCCLHVFTALWEHV